MSADSELQPFAPHRTACVRLLEGQLGRAEPLELDPAQQLDPSPRFAAALEEARKANPRWALGLVKARASLAMLDAHGAGRLADASAFQALTNAWTRFADWSLAAALSEAAHTVLDQPVPNASGTQLSGAKQPLAPGLFILGLGKLGGHDLNYSSDVDLICFVDGPRMEAALGLGRGEASERAGKVLKRLNAVLAPPGGPRVWRTDWRLRPDAPSSPLAQTLASAQQFFLRRSEPWNRLAMLKARPVAGELAAGVRFLRGLEGYLWRHALDFEQLDEIAALKVRINAEHPRLADQRAQGPAASLETLEHWNVKLGIGGIREIEFIVNAQQLIWGGRHCELRVTETLTGLDVLHALGLVGQSATDDLRAAYVAFRVLENRLQLHADGHTHTIPGDPRQRAVLATLAGFGSWESYADWLSAHRHRVAEHFATTFELILGERPGPAASAPAARHGRPSTFASNAKSGPSDAPFGTTKSGPTKSGPTKSGTAGSGTALRADTGTAPGAPGPGSYGHGTHGHGQTFDVPWHQGFRAYLKRHPDRPVPGAASVAETLTTICAQSNDPQRAANQLDRFLHQTRDARRLLTLLTHNRDAIDLIIAPMLASTFIATLLEQTPAVADVVIDRRRVHPGTDQPTSALPEPQVGLASAQAFVFGPAEIERQLEALRAWTNEQAYLVALNVFTAARSPEWGMATYSALAETTITLGCALARTMTGMDQDPLSIAAYGRLGGRALVPGSDLDLVFFAADAPDTAPANRFAARLRSALGARMRGGRVYEIDTRLRPWGSSGPPVVPMAGFERHQFQGARTWEHLALYPARFVCGRNDERARFEATQTAAITNPRDHQQLQRDGALMLHRLRASRTATVAPNSLRIKERIGGLLETEYLVAFLALQAGMQRKIAHEGQSDLKAGLEGQIESRDAGPDTSASQQQQGHDRLVDVARSLEHGQPDLAGLSDALACWQRWYFLIRLIANEAADITALLNAGSPATAGVTADGLDAEFAKHAARIGEIIDARLLPPALQAEIEQLDLSDVSSRETPVVWATGKKSASR